MERLGLAPLAFKYGSSKKFSTFVTAGFIPAWNMALDSSRHQVHARNCFLYCFGGDKPRHCTVKCIKASIGSDNDYLYVI